jgi:hypothetical protein
MKGRRGRQVLDAANSKRAMPRLPPISAEACSDFGVLETTEGRF